MIEDVKELISKEGTSILELESCKMQGLPMPEMKVVAPFVNLTIWFDGLLNEGDTPSDTSSDSPSDSPSDRILEFCRSPKNIGKIAEMLGMKDKKLVRKKYIVPLLQDGQLRMTIPDKPNSQYQKYETVE